MREYKKSKLENYFNNLFNKKVKDSQLDFDLDDFYKTSFKNSRNKKTDSILKKYSFLSSEKNFISDNILIVNSSLKYIQKFILNAFIIADRKAIEFIDNYYTISLNTNHICYIDDINSGEDLRYLIEKIFKGNYSHLLTFGGGRTLDFAKFISLKNDIKIIAFPSSLATHVYASPKIHALPPIKELGFQNTIDGESSHLSILDIDLLDKLYKENRRLILSGFGDLMAFINARHDWIQSAKNGNERFSIIVDESIDFIITSLVSIDIKKPLKFWIEEYIFIQCLLCNITHWVGSAPASGAEHLFAKCIEEEVLEPPFHGEAVALGVLIFSYIRNKDIDKVTFLLKKFKITNSISKLNLNKHAIINALNRSLIEGNKKKRYTILNDLDISYKFFEEVINSMINKKLLEI